MRARAEDVWRDLRERRLWPVALLLLVALVLVPVLLLEPAPEVPAQPAVAPAPSAVEGSPVALESRALLVAEGSDLDVFTARDPFRRPRPARRRSSSERAASGSGSPASGQGSSTSPDRAPADSSPASAGSPSGAGATPSPSPSPSPSPATGEATSPRGSADGGDATGPSSPVGAESSRYTDVVDIRFGQRGEERTISAVARMRALPSEQRPVVTFLGPSASGRSAVFLLGSPPVEQAGDGACKPSPKDCRFLSLRLDRAHDQHFFTDASGNKHSLRLLAIERMPVSDVLAREARRRQGGGDDRQ